MAGKRTKTIRQTFASKSFKAGSYSLAVCAVALVIAVLVNLIAGTLPARFTQLDISANDLYTLSDHSKQVAKGLQDDVTIYHLTTEANRDKRISALLDRYADLSAHIRVEERDPQISQIASEYTKSELGENSLIFVSGKRSKVVDNSAMLGYSEEASMYAAYYGEENVSKDLFSAEREITSALDFVTKDVLPKVYTLTGHGEYELDSSVEAAVASENIELTPLDLTLEKTIPEDCACLLLLAPDTDLTAQEQETVRAYFEQGGNLLISTLVPAGLKSETPNFDSLLLDLGIENGDGFIIEGDSSGYFSYPNYLIPTLDSHEITDPILDSKYHVYFPIARTLRAADTLRSTLEVVPLMHTSDASFGRIGTENTSVEQADGDLDGPFDVAFAVTETLETQTAHAVVFATPYFLDPNFSAYAGNMSLLLNALKWMCDLEETISVVETKSLSDEGSLEVNDSGATLWSVLLTVLLPLALLVVGIVIFVRRKKR